MEIWRGRFPILNHKYRTGKSIRLIIQIARRMFVQISVNDYRAKKQLLPKDFIYIENGQSITIFWQAIICPESCLLAVFFLINEFRANLLPLLWVWFDPCRQCVNLRDDISFPQFFPDLYFQSLGKKILNTQRILFKKCMASGIILHGTTSIVYIYKLH